MSNLECGVGSGGVGGGEGGVHRRDKEEEGSVCSSNADDSSSNSQFYSTVDGEWTGSSIDYTFELDEGITSELRRVSDVSVEIEIKDGEIKLNLSKVDKDCRICHLSLMDCSENGLAIELGCSCKGDLASAHTNCAETWFKIKGNKTCEICNSIACNIVGPSDTELTQQQMNETHSLAMDSAGPAPIFPHSETRTCLNGHRFLNFLLACMVFAFVISWLFHFNIPS